MGVKVGWKNGLEKKPVLLGGSSMDNIKVAEQLLGKICSIDTNMDVAMRSKPTREHVIRELSRRFENIVKDFPHLIEDIQRRIVLYQTNRGADGKITDFILLVEWYSMCLPDKPVEYWDTNGQYYNLRMDEVITMFLMARFNVV
jgi:hypothetical protein